MISTLTTIAVIIKLLDWIHDALHPFFTDKEKISNDDLDKILDKLNDIQNEVKNLKKSE